MIILSEGEKNEKKKRNKAGINPCSRGDDIAVTVRLRRKLCKGRCRYEDPAGDAIGLDAMVWQSAFEHMEQFIQDVKILPGDLELDYTPVIDMFTQGQAAIIRAGGSNTVAFQNSGIDAVFLPYFGQDGEQWLLTYPAFQVALNKDLEKDKTRQEKAMRVLGVMLSEEGQNALAKGEDVITYSQNVDLELSPYLDNLVPLIQQNHMYIRVASNDFFAVSKDVVSKMIQGEYNARQAYEAFDAQLKQPKDTSAETVLTLDSGYSNIFHKNGGNASGSVFAADYSEKMVGNMIMPNALAAWRREMKGDELMFGDNSYIEEPTYCNCPMPAILEEKMQIVEDNVYTLFNSALEGGNQLEAPTEYVTILR